MLQIAVELKGFVNEVGYVAQVGESEFDLRYYSSEREVDFCGHATIAIMYDIVKNDVKLSNFDTLTINTNRGTLIVENRVKQEDAVFIMSPVPEYNKVRVDSKEIAKYLRIDVSSIDTTFTISTINAGLNTLIVPITSLDAILAVSPHLEELKAFCVKIGVDIIELFTKDVHNKSNHYRTRVFAPTFGYIEDPATGSGNSAFGYYLLQFGLWVSGSLSIEQNGLKENFNVVKLQRELDKLGRTRVCFGGGAVTRVEGEYSLY